VLLNHVKQKVSYFLFHTTEHTMLIRIQTELVPETSFEHFGFGAVFTNVCHMCPCLCEYSSDEDQVRIYGKTPKICCPIQILLLS
jgi:hypothetical protein